MRYGRRVFLLLALVAMAGCLGETPEPEDEPTIVATTYPLAFTASQLSDDRFTIQTHDVQSNEQGTATFKDLMNADLVLFNGAGFEPFNTETANVYGLNAWTATERIKTLETFEASHIHHHRDHDHHDHGHHHHHDHGTGDDNDPYVWLDPIRMQNVTHTVLDALKGLDPENAALYETRAQELHDALQGLHERYKSELRNCETTHMFVQDPAWTYIIWRYDLFQHHLTDLDDEEQQQDLKDRMDLFDAHVYFHPPEGPTANIEAFAQETNLTGLPLHNLAYLSPDERTAGETYFTLMNKNLDALNEGLGCQ